MVRLLHWRIGFHDTLSAKANSSNRSLSKSKKYMLVRNECLAKGAGPDDQSAVATQKGVAMNLIYNSKHYAILAYPIQESFELVDKRGKRSLFVQGSIAIGLREAINRIPDDERDMDSIDSLLDDYCVGSAKPIFFH
jgi:hypothetical protein